MALISFFFGRGGRKLEPCYNIFGIVRIGIFSFRAKTVLCNKSAIRLCAVDSSEKMKGAVKSNIGLRMCQESSQAQLEQI